MVQLQVTRPLPDPSHADRMLEDPGTWLPAPATAFGPSTWRVDVHAGPIHRRVALFMGGVWQHGTSAWRALRWEPIEDGSEVVPMESLLPVFVGELGVVTKPTGDVELQLRGAYDPPGGLAGVVADRAGLHRVAERTAGHLLDAIIARLSDGPVAVGTHGPRVRDPRP